MYYIRINSRGHAYIHTYIEKKHMLETAHSIYIKYSCEIKLQFIFILLFVIFFHAFKKIYFSIMDMT